MIILTIAQAAAAAAAVATDPVAGPIIGAGAVVISGTAIGRYMLNRFAKLEDSLAEAREDISLIMGGLNIQRPPRRRSTEGV